MKRGRLLLLEGATLLPCVHCHERFSTKPCSADELVCRRHAGLFAGFERGKLYGGASGDFPECDRVVYHWDCCGASDERAPGCVVGSHEGYGGEVADCTSIADVQLSDDRSRPPQPLPTLTEYDNGLSSQADASLRFKGTS